MYTTICQPRRADMSLHLLALHMYTHTTNVLNLLGTLGHCLCCVAAGVFGQHLEETMLYEAQCGPQRLVPVLVEQCVCFIREHGLEEEGLFRAPGQTNHVRELQDAFDRGEKPVFDR